MVFAINGDVNSGDLYGSIPLFGKLWPRLLKAAAIEAMGEYKRDVPQVLPQERAVRELLEPPPSARGCATELAGNQQEVTQEYGGNILLETRERNQPDRWLRRSYLAKTPGATRR